MVKRPALQGLQSALGPGADPIGDPNGRALMQRGMEGFEQNRRNELDLTGFSGGVAPDPNMEGFLQALKEKNAAVTPSGGVSSPGSNQLVGHSQQPGPIGSSVPTGIYGLHAGDVGETPNSPDLTYSYPRTPGSLQALKGVVNAKQRPTTPVPYGS
jgi:hypothetical protein